MAYCKECGKKLGELDLYCPECGTKAESVNEADANECHSLPIAKMTSEREDEKKAPVKNDGKEEIDREDKITSIGGWFGWIVFTHFLPIIGTLFMAFGSKSKSTQNYGKALLILQLILSLFVMAKWEAVSAILGWIV